MSSVNGATGDVVLDADDVGALSSTYTPPAQSWADVTEKPETFAPTAHAASHADGGSDPSPWIASTADKPVSALTVMGYVPCGASMTIDTVSVYVQTAQAGAVGTIEVYADASLRPGSLVASITTLDFSTAGRKDFSTTLTGTGFWFKVTSTVSSVRVVAASPVGPGAGIGNTSPSQTMPAGAGQYPLLGGMRADSFVPAVMLRRSA